MKSGGFTLMEVLAALAVLSFGTLAVGRFLEGFNQLRSVERKRALAVIDAVESMEYFVQNTASCADTTFVRNGVSVVRKGVPGAVPVAWVWVASGTEKQLGLRRLVRCKKI